MTPKTEVAVPDVPQLPALVNPNADALGNLDGGDVTLPRLYKGEYQSALVQDDVVPKGCIFVATGKDDPDPQVIAKLGEKILVHVLRAWKGKSANIDDAGRVVKSGGTFTTWAFNDPTAPEGANVDFHYVVLLPDVDPDVPVKLTMAKTSVPAAKKINFLLLKVTTLPPYRLAFELNTKPREKSADGQTYKWYVWEARAVEAKPENIEAAAVMAEMIATTPQRNDIEATVVASDAPAI